jgi:hypothetical protein
MRAQSIVQIAAQAAAFFFARGDEPLARALQVGGEAHGVGGNPGLMGDVFQQSPLGGGERFAGSSRRENKLPDDFALI